MSSFGVVDSQSLCIGKSHGGDICGDPGLTHSYTFLFNKHLLSSSSAPGSVPGTEDTKVNSAASQNQRRRGS